MRKILLVFLLPLALITTPSSTLAMEYQAPSDLSQNLVIDSADEGFYNTASRLVQQQIYLIARLEKALSEPDPNQIRSVRGQLTIQSYSVESFLKRRYSSPKTFCTTSGNFSKQSLALKLNKSQGQIYCSLYAYNQELFKLRPVIDRLLSRRGELALVRQLPLVSGERLSDPVLSIAPVQYPDLGKLAAPLSGREPNLGSSPLPVVGRNIKTAIANYVPPMQPAIIPPEAALITLKTANQFLAAALTAFPPKTKFIHPQETAATLDRFAYDIDSQEQKIYAQFLKLPNTGIFRVLTDSAYRHQPNTLQNRLSASVRDSYPFLSLSKAKGDIKISLALQIVGDHFNLRSEGIDYGFMTNLGDIPLEKLDQSLKNVASPIGEFFLNYQPPTGLEALQVDKRRFLTGKNQNWPQGQVLLSDLKAELNHTYLVRWVQFQIPEIISPQNSRDRQQLAQIPSSDIILAFRPVRRHSNGSYTILWRLIQQFPSPQIEDIENYLG
ncbi:hypothetical protein VB711_19620 [Cronbergia sp. UHCC 0137]|uniref:hypothetical protein n=1 Tax=Cronbergia sp. UHCC 0137 TaxID=3110239 RepID=UPI002B1FB004|nr:hypothetical protein [Cronbergia sp. UHCC 0137]MEA5620037.1 hypothetical protein [Cronbergia sp. UHCC 0137]